MTKNYIIDLQQALRELLLMSSEREQLETKIAKQKKRVAALYELVQTDDDAAAIPSLVEGITDACRVVLRAAEDPLTPSEIRDKVQALGLPSQANLLASIHTTLKRMKIAGELDETTKKVGPAGEDAVAYTWKGNTTEALAATFKHFEGIGERMARMLADYQLPSSTISGVVKQLNDEGTETAKHPAMKLKERKNKR